MSGTRLRSLHCVSIAGDVQNLGKSNDSNSIYSNKGDAWHDAVIHTENKKDLAQEDECDLIAKTRRNLRRSGELTFC